MKVLTLRSYIRETKELYTADLSMIARRVGVSIEKMKGNKKLSEKDFYYLGLAEPKYMGYICNNSDFLDVSRRIGSPTNIYHYCYNLLPFNPYDLKQMVINLYGNVL